MGESDLGRNKPPDKLEGTIIRKVPLFRISSRSVTTFAVEFFVEFVFLPVTFEELF